MTITPIGKQGITPRLVLEDLRAEIDQVEDLYVIAFTKDGNRLYCAGDLSSMALAALLLQELAVDYLRGERE